MENIGIIVLLLVLIIPALIHAKKHFSGGGCCGSGGNTIRSHKKLTEPKIGEKVLTVEGMHCENCRARVENAVDRLDGAVCKVNLKKKTAVVLYSSEIPDDVLKETVEKLGYKVTDIR